MPTAFDVRALDSDVRVRLDDSVPEADRERIREQWIDLIIEDAEPIVTVTGTLTRATPNNERSARVVWADSPERLAALLTTEVTLAGIAALAGAALMLHAGAVALDDGRVIALVGPSGRGKTTATKSLGRTLGYVTDETLAVYSDGSVVPYRKPLAIGRHPEAKTPMTASRMGLRDLPSAPLKLAAIVVLDRRDHVDVPYVEQVSLLDALDEIVPQTSSLSTLARPLHTLVTTILSTGGARRVVYSESNTLPALIDDMLAASSAEMPQLVEVSVSTARDCNCAGAESPGNSGNLTAEAAPAPIYRRTDYRDAISIDDSLVVLSRNRVTVLDGLGPVVWFAADDATEAELTDAALREMPEPPEHINPIQVVAATVGELMEAELLTRA